MLAEDILALLSAVVLLFVVVVLRFVRVVAQQEPAPTVEEDSQ